MAKRFEELDRPTCLSLLARERLGRLAVIVDGVPLAFPMQFVLDDDRIVMRTNPGAKFHAAPLTNVSFEVDHVDFDREEGWSVIVQGVAEDISTAIDERSEHFRALSLQTWAPDPKSCWLTIVPRAISGRRIVDAD